MNIKYTVGIIVAVVVLIGAFVLINAKMNGSDTSGVDLTSFAMCLKKSGTVMYGAFWCPHCAATKKMFGDAAADLPYHECSTPDGNSQLADCTAKGIAGYPTWIFPDGTRLQGETTLQVLSQRSDCALPAGVPIDTSLPTASSTGASSAAE